MSAAMELRDGLMGNTLEFLQFNVIRAGMISDSSCSSGAASFSVTLAPNTFVSRGKGKYYVIEKSASGELSALYLPWEEGKVHPITLSSGGGLDLMFTGALTGCTVTVTGRSGAIKVKHYNNDTYKQKNYGSMITSTTQHEKRGSFGTVIGVKKEGEWKVYYQKVERGADHIVKASGGARMMPIGNYSVVDCGELEASSGSLPDRSIHQNIPLQRSESSQLLLGGVKKEKSFFQKYICCCFFPD